MRNLVGLAFLLSLSVAPTACNTACIAAMEKMGYAKRGILGSRVKSARDAQKEAKKEIQNALEQFGNVASDQGGDMEATYKKLNDELQRSQDSAEADKFIQSMEKETG